jgi:hypothetical protein
VILFALVPLLVGLAGARYGRRIAARLVPSVAVLLLTILALSVALATGFVLCLAAVVAVAELPASSWIGHWSADTLRDNIPIPPGAGIAAGAVAVLLAGSAVLRVVRVVGNTRRVQHLARELRPRADGLVVLDDPGVAAYAIAGRHGRIVVSTGMLRLLTGPQRRALLAHEAAHLRYHHQAYVQLGHLAAAANPLMRPVARAIEFGVERWADEVAAREIGDRTTVARALVAAALGHARTPRGALAGAGQHVLERVGTLLVAPPPARQSLAGLLVLSAAGCWIATILVGWRVHHLLELAARLAAH